MTRIRKKGKCFKCLKTDHRFINNNALCKIAESLSKKQINVILKTIDVENDIIDDSPTSKFSKN